MKPFYRGNNSPKCSKVIRRREDVSAHKPDQQVAEALENWTFSAQTGLRGRRVVDAETAKRANAALWRSFRCYAKMHSRLIVASYIDNLLITDLLLK